MMKRRSYKLIISLLLMAAGLGVPLAQENDTWVVPHILNTNRMEWMPVPDLKEEGWLEKVLAVHPATGAKMRILYIPPGWIDKTGINERHFTEYREWGLVLFGDLPFCTYTDPSDDTCDLVIQSQGLYVERPRYQIHGTEGPQRTAEFKLPVSKTGYVSFAWRERQGAIYYLHRPTEERFLTMDKSQFRPARYIQTNEMDWQPHPTLKGWLIKPLSLPDDDMIKVSIVDMPAGWVDQPNLGKPVKVQNHEFRYVLSGEMPLWYYKRADQREPESVMLQDGYFVHLPPGAVLGAGQQPPSRTGCAFLQIIRYDLR
ncbi:MAG: hypothetical protein HY314_10175 [Acidobacteria bacterium]|nr:hypothetical protein [Acidobacteriota bacterium]